MGMYISWEDVANRYPDMADKADAREGDNFYVTGAEAEVNAAASQKYTVPFIPGSMNVPAMIRDVSIDLTYWKAVGWQNEKLSKTQRDDIDRRLKGIADGTIALVNSGGLLVQRGIPFAYSTQQEVGSPRSSFGHDDAVKWSVSASLTDAEAAERSGD